MDNLISIGKYDLTPDQFHGKAVIDEDLFLDELLEIPEGFNPIVSGMLSLMNVKSIPFPFSPVCLMLDMGGISELPPWFKPVVEKSAKFHNAHTIHSGFNPIIGYTLLLPELKVLPSDFNITVGGTFTAQNLKVIPNNVTITVGENCVLKSVRKIGKNFKVKAGKALFMSSIEQIPSDASIAAAVEIDLPNLKSFTVGTQFHTTGIIALDVHIPVPAPVNLKHVRRIEINDDPSDVLWKNDDMSMYFEDVSFISPDCKWVYAAGKLSKINAYKKLNDIELFHIQFDIFKPDHSLTPKYLVHTKGIWAHGHDINHTKITLAFKFEYYRTMVNPPSVVKTLSLDTYLPANDAINLYCEITGADYHKVIAYLQEYGIMEDQYSVRDMLMLSEGQFGHTAFSTHFTNHA